MDATELTKERFPQLRNVPVYTADGEQIGHVGDAYYDEDSERLECVGVAADAVGFLRRVVPVRGATVDEEGLHLPYTRADIERSPQIDEEMDEERYRGVEEHYVGVEASVTRSEEELQVGKREGEAGRVRLRKWVETEPAEAEIELEHETARVTRERIDEPAAEADLGEEEIEVPLREEEAVVEKEAVAKERIGIQKDVEVERETVREDVRKERVEVEEDDR